MSPLSLTRLFSDAQLPRRTAFNSHGNGLRRILASRTGQFCRRRCFTLAISAPPITIICAGRYECRRWRTLASDISMRRRRAVASYCCVDDSSWLPAVIGLLYSFRPRAIDVADSSSICLYFRHISTPLERHSRRYSAMPRPTGFYAPGAAFKMPLAPAISLRLSSAALCRGASYRDRRASARLQPCLVVFDMRCIITRWLFQYIGFDRRREAHLMMRAVTGRS